MRTQHISFYYYYFFSYQKKIIINKHIEAKIAFAQFSIFVADEGAAIFFYTCNIKVFSVISTCHAVSHSVALWCLLLLLLLVVCCVLENWERKRVIVRLITSFTIVCSAVLLLYRTLFFFVSRAPSLRKNGDDPSKENIFAYISAPPAQVHLTSPKFSCS